jgi:glyoxylase-like metal-dependent hydrolase (beta-lactamase superfamily II)
MLIDGRPLWLAQTNTWVIAPESGGLAVVIDAPPDPSGVLDLLARHDLTPVALLLTHGHVDHAGGAGRLVRAVSATAFVHPADDFLTLDPSSQLRMLFGMVPPGEYDPPESFTALADGDRLNLAGIDFDVLHTPGHTPGHCCFSIADEGVLFSGDQLFAGSIGRTDLPGGDTDKLMASMRSKIMPLDDDVRVLPGHGPETTIGSERTTNPFRSYWQ